VTRTPWGSFIRGETMTVLAVTRGLPGSGKTTCARAWVAEDRRNRVRVNRDDLRDMIDDGTFIKGVTEGRIIAARDALICYFLERGKSVICDDTNLPDDMMLVFSMIAEDHDADFEVVDLRDVPLEECIKRNAARSTRKIPEDVIRKMHADYIEGRIR
jgi:tRNA uridine 5-carbamoylmethylation protein Kti12